ncbi:unnamed protein product, partial [Timema podura]|nr:unnamed protein product [Timema podura]
ERKIFCEYRFSPDHIPPTTLAFNAWSDLLKLNGERVQSREVYPYLRGGKVENHLVIAILSTPSEGSNPNLPVIGSLAYHESDTLDHAATESDELNLAEELAPTRQNSFDWLIARLVTTFLFCTCFSVNINAIVVTLALRAAMAAGMGKGKSRANKIGEPERRMVMTALRVQIPWTDARASLLLLHPSRRSERSWGDRGLNPGPPPAQNSDTLPLDHQVTSQGWLKGWFSLCSLLGVTWVFGLAFMEYYPSFEYIFVILNGCQIQTACNNHLFFCMIHVSDTTHPVHSPVSVNARNTTQPAHSPFNGVFIFLFRCLLNKQVRSSVLNEAKQRASIKKFNRVAGNRSSWYIASQPPSSRHPSVGSGLGNSDSDSEIKQKGKFH